MGRRIKMSSSRLPLTAPCSSVVESKTLARSLECGVIPAVVYRVSPVIIVGMGIVGVAALFAGAPVRSRFDCHGRRQ